MTDETVTCPNCNGKNSSTWPFGPCKVCEGAGVTTPEKADKVIAARKAYQKEHGEHR